MSTTTKTGVLKGGEWLIKESSAFETFIPEDYTEEQQMVKDMCMSFLDTEVLPILGRTQQGFIEWLACRNSFMLFIIDPARGAIQGAFAYP